MLLAIWSLAAFGHARQMPGTSPAGSSQQQGSAGSVGAQNPARANPPQQDELENPILEQDVEE